MNPALGSNRRSLATGIVVLLVAALAFALMSATYATPAHSATAEVAKSKKKTKKKKATPAKDCKVALKRVNNALRARAVPRYRLKKATTAKQRKKYKRQVRAADKRVKKARATLTVLCAGSGTISGLDAECFSSITKLDKLINLQYERKMKLRRVKGNSKRSKKRRKVMRKRLKNLGTQIKTQTSTFQKSCGSGGVTGLGDGDPNGSDTTPPGAPGIEVPGSGSGGETNDQNPAVVVTPPTGETGGHAECKIVGVDNSYSGEFANFTQVASPWILPELPEGTYKIVCHWVDGAGNAGPDTEYTLVIDRTAPDGGPGVTVPGSGPGGETNAENPVVEVTPPAGETGGHAECKIVGVGNDYNGEFADFTEVASSWTLPALPEGTYKIVCHWVDAAGNPGPDTEYTLVIDRTAPGAPSVSGPEGPTNDTTPPITVETTEPGGTIECRLDGGDWQTAATSFDAPELEDGTHPIDCRQIDAAGNESNAGSTTVVIDTEAPGTPTIGGPDGPTSDSTPSFNLGGAGEGDSYWCRTDDGEFQQVEGNTYTTPELDDGDHTVTCHLVDEAGNPGEDTSADVSIDTHAPGSVTITGPSSPSNDTTPTLTITTSEPGGHIECSIDGGDFVMVPAEWTLPELGEGSHTVTCHQVTGTGVEGPNSSYTVVIDTTPPGAVTMTGPSGLTADNTPTYTLSGGTGGSFQCKVDGGAFATVASPFTTPALADGSHTITCRSVDAAGNASAPVGKTVSVDTKAPGLTINDGTPRWDGKHDFVISSDDPAASVKCKVDGGAYTTVGGTYTTEVLSNGSHTLTCVGTDAAGNASAPVVKTFGVFKDPVEVKKSGGFQWGLACTGSSTINDWLGCPDNGLLVSIPANPNGLTGTYQVDVTGSIKQLCSFIGFGSTYTLRVLVDGAPVANDSDSAGFDLFCLNPKNLSASKLNLTLSASSAHTVQLSLASSAFISVLPSVNSSSLKVSIHH